MDVPMLDKVPGYNIYIGGFISLKRPKALANCKITHILSVIDWKFADDSPLIKGYHHLNIPVDDVDDENLIEWFPKSNAFIEQLFSPQQYDVQDPEANPSQGRVIDGSSGVLVHCAMGKSRSATIIIAYLLWKTHRENSAVSAPPSRTNSAPKPSRDSPPVPSSEPLTPETALSLLRQSRPFAEPNDGFMEQLHLYHSMGCPDNIDTHPKYQRWLYQKNIQESLTIHRAPEIDGIRFEDEHEEEEDAETLGISMGKREIDIKCRKCRKLLARSNFLIEHEPSSQNGKGDAKTECAHLFLHPLSWMKESLQEGNLDGRLICPSQKCRANVGKFAWQGMRCSCGGWVTPGFGLARARVDEEIVSRKAGKGDAGGAGVVAAVRLPPGMRKEGGNL